MDIRELAVRHAWEISPIVRPDNRGEFLESFRGDLLAEATGRSFKPVQSNVSISRQGVTRGIHFAEVGDARTGQAKYVTVMSGSIVDFIVDIRVGSPTFGEWTSVALDDVERKAAFIAEGLGHLLVATSATAVVTYLTNDIFRPDREHTISPFDPTIALELPFDASQVVLSEQDRAAPNLAEVRSTGTLPTWEACLNRYQQLAGETAGSAE